MKKQMAQLSILVVVGLAFSYIVRGQQGRPASELVRQFEAEKVFWSQFEVPIDAAAASTSCEKVLSRS